MSRADESAEARAAISRSSRVFRVPAAQRWTLATCVALFAVLGTSIAWSLPPLQSLEVPLLLALLAGLVVLAVLAGLVLAECVAAFRLRIDLRHDSLAMRLPPRRGHVQRPPFAGSVPYSAISGIESRDESFRQLGLTAIQTAYRLVLKNGDSIELGADRQLRDPVFGPAARAIAARCGLGLRQGGMVDGRAGVLAAIGTSVPDWGATALPAAEARRRTEQGARATRKLGIFVLVMTLLRLILRR